MSELQIGLLAIGIAVVLAVYGYSAWQQRQYRRRFGVAFKPDHGDALYHGKLAKSGDDVPDALSDSMGQVLPEEPVSASGPDEVCKTLDAETDYLAVMFAASPLSAAVLAPLWHRRFDFGKVYVCGVSMAGGPWEKVLAESQRPYDTLRIALQLADRNGAVSAARLADFRDLLRDIASEAKAEVNLPDVEEAATQAQQLDAFCAEVDQMIGLNILPGGDRQFSGSEVAQVAEQHGLVLQADGAFHLLDARGLTRFTMANYDNVPFQHHTLGQARVSGLSLLLDVPRVEEPAACFDQMAAMAGKIAATLHAAVADDHRVTLSEAAISRIRAQVAAIEHRMLAYPIVPGSARARRLFS
jgi:hypothetical protein